MGVDDWFAGIGATTFSLMWARMVLHDADSNLFAETLERAVKGKLTALIDNRNLFGLPWLIALLAGRSLPLGVELTISLSLANTKNTTIVGNRYGHYSSTCHLVGAEPRTLVGATIQNAEPGATGAVY